MDRYLPVRSKKKIKEILAALVGEHIEMEIDKDGQGIVHIQLGTIVYRLIYEGCHEREDGNTHGTLVVIEELKRAKVHPWRLSAVVH